MADTVIMMDEYKPIDVTAKAKELAKAIPGGAPPEAMAGGDGGVGVHDLLHVAAGSAGSSGSG